MMELLSLFTCLRRDHQCGVSLVVLVIYVYKWTVVESVYDVNETFGAGHHQTVLQVKPLKAGQ